MNSDPSNKPLDIRKDHLIKVISSEQFLKMRGLGNDVPFFICAFEPEEANAMEAVRCSLVQHLEKCSVAVREINIYDLCIKMLKQEGLWEKILEMEPEWDKSELLDLLQSVLDPETHLAPKIAELTAGNGYDVLFLSGIGEVYPYIRSHNVLNNLQSRVPQKPVVLFFPGRYTYSPEIGVSLDLFGRLRGDKYYRAKNIFEVEP
jgi:hypothetical protein